LPEVEDYKPTGNPEPPLSKAKDWLLVERDGRRYRRETNTMPQWAGSCWYYLRYLDPNNDAAFCDPAKLKTWLPVNLYVGGAEHAVLHLLYSRFWHKVLFDRGYVPVVEPFQRLVNQGMILGSMEFTGFKCDGKWISAERVDFDGDVARLKRTETKVETVKLDEDQVEKERDYFVPKGLKQMRVDARAYKMSKARGNVINPDEVVKQYGADSLRLYEMFMGPLEATKPWSMRGVEGVFRFLNRVWRLVIDDRMEEVKLLDAVQDVEPDTETRRLLHATIQRVTNDLETMSFNTAIAAMMELSNHLTKQTVRSSSVLKTFMLVLSPFAPHLAEEIWSVLNGRAGSASDRSTLAYEPWPSYDESLLKAETIEVPVQINGKVKSKLTVSADLDQADLEKLARGDEKIIPLLEGKTIRRVIVVPGKLVNLVVE
jgi:leucyl-tRNA synthetase